ncbi:stage II sporulation protein M [Thermococcus sp. AM4]|uniref:stage II sporulation protein M n=1 Tax=Thermococcus sp. (strain AM4) TaxID=246969 RepID=UPI000186FF32|nr:stage II sporulation protein M [Thermococcus sp. AM4]EEB74618.1 hypothetical protein TAM4_563 [Thermococcus sp. AM4]
MRLSLGERAKELVINQLIRLAIGFVVSAFLGVLVAVVFPKTATNLFVDIGKSIAGKVGDREGFGAFLSIYVNNLTVATSAYALGIFFGIVPWIIVLINGFILGLVLAVVVSMGLISPVTAMLAVLPHGILEIPAILLAAAAGILVYRGTLKREGLDVVYDSLKLYALSAVLLLVAAFIEAFITPRVAGL